MAYRSTNPYTNTVELSFDELSDHQLKAMLQAAQSCFAGIWRDRSFSQRKTVLKRAAALMRERQQALAAFATREIGKLIGQSAGEVAHSAAIIDYYADHAESFLAPEALKTDSGEAVVESSPMGILFGVEPCNYPYYQIVRFAAPNLMAGNVVMVKHASNVPQCELAFEQLMHDAGLPAGGYTNLFVSKDQVARLIDDERVCGVALTGSEAACAVVAARAGQTSKSLRWSWAAATPSLCWKTPTWRAR